MKSYFVVFVLLAGTIFAQQSPKSSPNSSPQAQPVVPESSSPSASALATHPTTNLAAAAHKAPDHAASYYHYSLAHIYEELVAVYGRSDLAN